MTIHDTARAAMEKVYEDEQRRLQHLVDSAAEQLEGVTLDRDRIATALAISEDELAESRAATAEAQALVLTLRAELTQARARIAELEASTEPEPEPEPEPTPRALLGANPMTGSNVSTATRRWGAGIAVRIFDSDELSPAPAIGDAGRILISWKPSTTVTEAQVRTAVANLPAGSKVGVWHEPDVKVRKGSNSAAGMKARAREFYAIVKRIRPDLDVMAVLSEWTFSPSTNYDPLAYIDLGTFDVLALDLDGGDPGPRDYRPAVAEAQAWMRANGVTRWTVAEYGVKLTTGFTAADRAAWLKQQTEHLLNLEWPPEEICLFELNDGGEGSKYILTGADKAEWDRLTALGA